MVDHDQLTVAEQRAIERFRQLAAKWPKSLSLFSNNGSLEIHKNGSGEPYTDETYVDNINGISNDGGDRD